MSLSQKELVEELKIYWKKLWQDRVDDKVRAEGVAAAEYIKLFVEKGTVIQATRDYKALNFKEILDQNKILNADLYISPSPQVGGWGKFVRTTIVAQRQKSGRAMHYSEGKKERQQFKKGGRGWLHI